MKTVLLLSTHAVPWQRQFPGPDAVWGNCRFIFEDNGTPYDYLVVFDVPPGWFRRRCRFGNTIHIGTETIPLGRYDQNYIDQFAHCLTLDPTIKHPGAIPWQGGLNWHVGAAPRANPPKPAMGWDELRALFDEERTKLISVISSNLNFSPGHRKRLAFAQGLKEHFGDRLDFFGRGIRDMEDKLEALRGYRFHIALENSSYPHYFSEKLSDPLIAGCQPIYWGCPNVTDYFPPEALILIDIDDLPLSIQRIERAIAEDFDRRNVIQRRIARNRVFYEHNIFPMLVERIAWIEAAGKPRAPYSGSWIVRSGWIGPDPAHLLIRRVKRRLTRAISKLFGKV